VLANSCVILKEELVTGNRLVGSFVPVAAAGSAAGIAVVFTTFNWEVV
jgi:hypothetical protein